ncbi:hypothetical protein FI667_g10199, partial [Globisporangium splendens]
MMHSHPQRARVRGNRAFRIAAPELNQETPGHSLPCSPSLRTKSVDASVVRPILYHAGTHDVDNNRDTILYKRIDHELDDDGNNHASENEDFGRDGCRASRLSHSPVPQASSSHSVSAAVRTPMVNDIRLESIDGSHDSFKHWSSDDHPDEDEEEDADFTSEQQQDECSHCSNEESLRAVDDAAVESNQTSLEVHHHTRRLRHHLTRSDEYEAYRRPSFSCDPMVRYELDSVRKSQQIVLSRFARHCATANQDPERFSSDSLFSSLRSDPEDDDIVNIRSPVTQKSKDIQEAPPRSDGHHHQHQAENKDEEDQQQREAVQPQIRKASADGSGWTSEQFCQYNDILGFLQEACASSSPRISIPCARLAQMEQLLRSLRPKVSSTHPSGC